MSSYEKWFTFAIIKPDAISRNLTGDIISRFERKGFILHSMEQIEMRLEQAQELYSPHKEKEFYQDLCEFMTEGSCIVMVLMRPNEPVSTGRDVVDQIRRDFSWDIQNNCVHASDSLEAVEREAVIFFPNLF